MLQKIRTGDIDFIISSNANASTVSPQSGVFSLHYIFTSDEQLAKALADPAIVKAMRDMFDETVKGARVLGLATLGLRAIELERQSITRLEKIGVKFSKNVDKTGFIAASAPINDKLAEQLGPHAVKVLSLVRAVK